MSMQQVDRSAESEREEHSIGELSGRHTMSLKDFRKVSNASNAHKTSYSYVEVERSTVSMCTDMHGYGMRTILYPYGPNRSTNRGRRTRDTVIVSMSACWCRTSWSRGFMLWRRRYLVDALEMFLFLLLQVTIELILAYAFFDASMLKFEQKEDVTFMPSVSE